MIGRPSARLVLILVLSLIAASVLPTWAEPGRAREYPDERTRLAQSLLRNSRVSLLNYHVSGRRDSATARDNLVQTAKGLPAKLSYYGRAPGGTTRLDVRMLRALHILTREGYSFRITELAGGSHSSRSRHYVGVAFDIDFLNGRKVKPGHPTYRRFLQRCRQLGATEVFGPGTRGHSTHLHIAWPLR